MEKQQINIVLPTRIGEYSLNDQEYVDYLRLRFDVNVLKIGINGEVVGDVEPDLIVFTGGSDVSPALYGEEIADRTGVSIERDAFEALVFNNYIETKKLGICRGSQFLTVMAGGKLVQHVNGHLGNHNIVGADGGYEITSTHHQMMYPFELDKEQFEMVYSSSEARSTTYLNGDDEETELAKGFVESEIVKYPLTKSLCIQGHPEMYGCPDDTVEMTLDLIEDHLN